MLQSLSGAPPTLRSTAVVRLAPGILLCGAVTLAANANMRVSTRSRTLGVSVSFAAVLAVGPALLAGIGGVVVVALAASYGLGRLLGLPRRMAVLVASTIVVLLMAYSLFRAHE